MLQGKTGEYLVEASTRHDLNQPGVKGELLTRHGRFDEPPVQCLGENQRGHEGEWRGRAGARGLHGNVEQRGDCRWAWPLTAPEHWA